MVDASYLSRRRILQGGIALGVLGLAEFPAPSAFAAPAAASRLPERGNIVIRNAYVMTMEPGTPDIRDGDAREGWRDRRRRPEAQRAGRDDD
jgi:hypothetical protein